MIRWMLTGGVAADRVGRWRLITGGWRVALVAGLMLSILAPGALAAQSTVLNLSVVYPSSTVAGRNLRVVGQLASGPATRGARVRQVQQVGRRWVVRTSAPVSRSRRFALKWRVGAIERPLMLRVSAWRGNRRLVSGAAHEVLVSVAGRVSPNRATTISAGGFSLTVPAGVVSSATTATATPLDSSAAGLPGPAVRFHIDASWSGHGKRVRVTLPVDPDLQSLGRGYTPVLVHLLDGGGAQLLAGRSLSVAHGRVTYETSSLSSFVSFSLPKVSLPSLASSISLDLGNWLGQDLSTFMSAHSATPSCSPNSTSAPGVSSGGNAFSPLQALDYQPTLKYCVSIQGSTATWTLANNTGTVLILSIDGTNVRIGNIGSSGDPGIDYAFAKINKQVNAGSVGGTPATIVLPGTASVSVSVPAGSTASLGVDESPLGTVVTFIMSQTPAGAAGALYNAVVQCGYSPAKTGRSTLSWAKCLFAAAQSLHLGAKVLKVVGKVLLGFGAAITLKQQLGIGHLQANLRYTAASGSPSVTVTPPGNQTGTVGTAVNLPIHASDTDNGALRYTASGLPAGLSIDPTTGRITGKPTTAATSTVTVTAADASGPSSSTSFNWTTTNAPSANPLPARGGTPPYTSHFYNLYPVPSWVTLAPDGTLMINPPAGDAQSYSFYTYAFDASGQHSPFARDTVTFQTNGGGSGPASATWNPPTGTGLSPTAASSVSCSSPTFCAAVDYYGNVAMFDGVSWSAPASSGVGDLTNVSCPTASFCLAVGWNAPGGVVDEYALTFNGTSWGAPVHIAHGGSAGLSLSCSSASFCVVVDHNNDLSSHVMTFDGNSWSNRVGIDSSSVEAVSCPSSSFCLAVDSAGNAMTFNGLSWSPPVSIDAGNYLSAVSCSSSSFCVAGDEAGNALMFNGSSWKTVHVDTPFPNRMESVSCTSSSFCLAVDFGGEWLTFDGSSWSAPAVLPSGAWMPAVSCTSSSFCLGVDYNSNAVTYTSAG